MNYIPEQLTSSVIANAITNTNSTLWLPSMGSGTQYLIHDLSVTNTHATVDAVVSILAGTTPQFSLRAGRTGRGGNHSFNPPLAVGNNQPVNVQSSASATITGAIRYSKTSA
jgi:hypothetical protein